MKKPKDFTALQTELTIKCWKDSALKKKLLSNPKETLAEMGYPTENNIEVKVIEEKPNTVTFVLGAQPQGVDINQLSESDLKKTAAASVHFPDYPWYVLKKNPFD